ncbi:carbohydrate ABC transporter membrane protein 2, CUT1 family (TC 3.A.1.1.-) [Stackebrandtia albiflava]|uniref:Carbohydrate ABC transporter membrane protein 2, CUT1 family (TC 3.A.1.1.-) n=1 Tax=Stackebrandtia albiflava TaxID=406432 RepID=A0A562UQP2_9ACTN|nr:carbohydrate ABC transporter permease [Stackebrandtia albiflava]TWJ07945.1 carbohydrate ABC transporter membrane protein 2, CUT1 family (TC 3.A.1.1.-) [Stackebrandtia albiflava]
MDITKAVTATEERVPRRRGRRRGGKWYLHVALSLICAVSCAPVVYAILVATQNNAQMINFDLTFGDSFLANLDTVWNDRDLGGFMVNSAIMAIIISVGKAATGLLAGLAFVYFRFPGRWIVFFFVLITLMMPTEISILALFEVTHDFGISGTMAGLTIPFLASATAAFLFRQHFANLPANLSEAAQLDGANPIQFLTRVLIPLSWNVLGALLVIEFLYGWNMYLWPLLTVNDRSDQVVQVGLASLQQSGQGQLYGPLMLGALIASIPPILVFLALQRPFMKGFAMARDK